MSLKKCNVKLLIVSEFFYLLLTAEKVGMFFEIQPITNSRVLVLGLSNLE